MIFLTAGNDEKKGQRSVMKIKEEILNAKGNLYGLFYYIIDVAHFSIYFSFKFILLFMYFFYNTHCSKIATDSFPFAATDYVSKGSVLPFWVFQRKLNLIKHLAVKWCQC